MRRREDRKYNNRFNYKRYYSELYSEEKYSKEMDNLNYPSQLRRFQTLLHLIKPKKKSKLLDIGAGKGILLELANKKGIISCGIEVSESRIKECIKKGLEVKYGDVYEMPYSDEYFDYVVVSEVLEHLKFPSRAIREIYRVLTHGGIVAVTVPIEKLKFTVCVHCGKKTPVQIGHLHEFDENKLTVLLERRFKIILLKQGINTFMVSNTLFLPFSFWNIFSKIMPKAYSKYIAIAEKE